MDWIAVIISALFLIMLFGVFALAVAFLHIMFAQNIEDQLDKDSDTDSKQVSI